MGRRGKNTILLKAITISVPGFSDARFMCNSHEHLVGDKEMLNEKIKEMKQASIIYNEISKPNNSIAFDSSPPFFKADPESGPFNNSHSSLSNIFESQNDYISNQTDSPPLSTSITISNSTATVSINPLSNTFYHSSKTYENRINRKNNININGKSKFKKLTKKNFLKKLHNNQANQINQINQMNDNDSNPQNIFLVNIAGIRKTSGENKVNKDSYKCAYNNKIHPECNKNEIFSIFGKEDMDSFCDINQQNDQTNSSSDSGCGNDDFLMDFDFDKFLFSLNL